MTVIKVTFEHIPSMMLRDRRQLLCVFYKFSGFILSVPVSLLWDHLCYTFSKILYLIIINCGSQNRTGLAGLTRNWAYVRFGAASSCTSIPSCVTPINFSYSKNTLFNIPDYIIRKLFFR